MTFQVIVTEAKKGESLTHIDDCHVLVIQEGGHTGGLDYDKFIISKIREIRVRFQPRPGEEDLQTVDISLDPNLNIDQVKLVCIQNSTVLHVYHSVLFVGQVVRKVSEATCLAAARLELYKCCATKSERRPAEFPVELQSEKNINRWAVLLIMFYNELCTYNNLLSVCWNGAKRA